MDMTEKAVTARDCWRGPYEKPSVTDKDLADALHRVTGAADASMVRDAVVMLLAAEIERRGTVAAQSEVLGLITKSLETIRDRAVAPLLP
jgi:ATP-dependent Clp protease ATP-binding subunit ClpA